MKEIIMYVLEYKKVYLLMTIAMALFYLIAYLDAIEFFRKPILSNKLISGILAFAITLMGTIGFLKAFLI